MDIRPVLYIVGVFLCVLALSMAIPAACDFYLENRDWKTFLVSMGLTGFMGILLILSNRQKNITVSRRQAFILTALSWIALCLFSSMPFFLAIDGISLTDALFESVSGLTTTGSTILTGLDAMPHGLLIWRSLLQWLGGIGIIVMAISVLPFLKVGGMQLFRLESSEKEKALPRATQLAAYIIYIYSGLTIICTIAYSVAGMSNFDAIAHAMTTISTGGFSTHDASFNNHETYGPEIVAIIFMVLGSLPFVLYIKSINGDYRSLMNDQQVRGFIKALVLSGFIMFVYLSLVTDAPVIPTIIEAYFTTTTLMTGTGFANTDYMMWGGFATGFLLFISMVGGCAGSATCAIKIFRFQILYAVAKNQIQQLIHPNAIFTVEYNNQPLSVQVAASVIAYFFIFAVSVVVFTLALLLCNLDFMTAFSGAVTSLSNVGPGLGNIIGPTGNFAPLPDIAKQIMIFAMLLGRLEFFTLLVFFFPRFWKH